MRPWLTRLAWAALTAAAVTVCARGLRAPWLFAFGLPCLAAPFVRGLAPPPRLARALSALLLVTLVPTLLLGWVLMAYPVLPPAFVRAASLLCGAALCLLCAALLPLRDEGWRSSRLGAAALGAIAVGAFDATNPIAVPLRAAGAAAVLLLAVGRLAPRRLARLAFVLVVAAVLAEATTRALPPAQDRVEAALASLATRGTSGASAHARLGEMESLQLSHEIVLRAWMPAAQRLRTRVYSRFDGQTWHPGAGGLVALVPAAAASAPELASVPGRTWTVPELPAGPLDYVQVVAAGLAPGAVAAPRGAVLLRASVDGATIDDADVLLPPARERLVAYAVAYAVATAARPPSRPPDAAVLAGALALPADTDPRLRELAGRLAEGLSDPRARAHRVAAWVSTRARYSTDPGQFRGRQPVAEFLFDKRAGYCEYFASASAVLLRLMGVPARYVTGYVVQEWSRSGDHYVVRAADTHAWIEAWAGAEQGWIELDPTPAAEYDALRRDGAPGFLARGLERLRGEAARAWAVLAAGDAGAALSLWRERPLLALPPLLLAAVLLRRAWRRRARVASAAPAPVGPSASPDLQGLRRRHDAAVARLGAPRPITCGLVEHALGLSAALPAETRAAVLRAAETLSAARFGGAPLAPARAATEALERAAPARG